MINFNNCKNKLGLNPYSRNSGNEECVLMYSCITGIVLLHPVIQVISHMLDCYSLDSRVKQ